MPYPPARAAVVRFQPGFESGGQFFKNMAQVTKRLQAIQFGGFDQAIQIGAGVSAFYGIRKGPVIAANHEGSNGAFGSIVIYIQPTIFFTPTGKPGFDAYFNKLL